MQSFDQRKNKDSERNDAISKPKNANARHKNEKSEELSSIIDGADGKNQSAQLQTIANNLIVQKRADNDSTPIQLFRNGYAPRLETNANNSNGAYSYDTFDRPQNFYQSTITAVYRDAEQRTARNPVSGRMDVYYKCETCDDWVPYSGVQIGHIENWATYVRDTNPANLGEARDAYNDLDNLELQCSTCNASHAFEEMNEDDDYDFDDDFIDDSKFNKKDNDQAFKELREDVIPKYQSTNFMDGLNDYNKKK